MAARHSQPIPEILYPQWQNEYVAALLGPRAQYLRNESKPQKPRSTGGFSNLRQAQMHREARYRACAREPSLTQGNRSPPPSLYGHDWFGRPSFGELRAAPARRQELA